MIYEMSNEDIRDILLKNEGDIDEISDLYSSLNEVTESIKNIDDYHNNNLMKISSSHKQSTYKVISDFQNANSSINLDIDNLWVNESTVRFGLSSLNKYIEDNPTKIDDELMNVQKNLNNICEHFDVAKNQIKELKTKINNVLEQERDI